MTALWTAPDLVAATGGTTAAAQWSVTGVSIDSRTVQPGDLFVALTDARDGHDFVGDALAKGAAAALVSRVPNGVDPARLLIVDDVLAALSRIGAAARARMQGTVIAVTGSVGKTTVKDMLRAILVPQGRTHAAEASYNNHWGVPLTLARMPADTDFAVIEIGMNAPGEIAPLARLAAPDLAVVTTVAPAHLEAFGVIEGIAHEKASIFDGLKPGGLALAHADIDTAPILFDKARAMQARLIRFGVADGVEAQLTDLHLVADATVVKARLGGRDRLFKLGVPGRHLAMNALIAMTVVDVLDLDLARAGMALAAWRPVDGRGTRHRIALDPGSDAAVDLIDDAYNANPASVAAGLDGLVAAMPVRPGRRVAVLGDMLELGSDAPALHAELADLPAMADIDIVHTVGPLMAHLHAALPPAKRGQHTQTAQKMVQALPRTLKPGDVVLVKGSKGIKVARVVDALKKLGQAASAQGRRGH